jgi:ubiquinone/menaquinone biosynthesis C-methylase UbiE
MTIATTLAKMLMQAWPSSPEAGDPWARYDTASDEDKRQIALESSRFRYEYEKDICFLSKYFPQIPPADLRGRSILDLGCFTGGRLVYWVERYGFVHARGIDIKDGFSQAGKSFAAERGVAAEFDTGFAENLPYPEETFDYITSYDVLEHVRSVAGAMRECHRVLKTGGRLLCVFPPFFQPLESHLGLATAMPALHWIFPGEVLTAAYYEILRERGPSAEWYRPQTPQLAEWERLPNLNGITVRKFRHIVKAEPGWRMLSWGTEPILSDGRRAQRPIFRMLRSLFVLPAKMPLLEELFLGRICCVLQKVARATQR